MFSALNEVLNCHTWCLNSRRQLQDLDTMTQSFKTRLSVQHQALDAGDQPWNTARSGDILIGTQSGLSSIHTASSLFNTQDSPGSKYSK